MTYFVESLPTSCLSCDCCHTKEYDNRYQFDGEKFCGIENMEVDYYYGRIDKPDWCPLHKIPKEFNGREVPYEVDPPSYRRGWNDCLNKMTSLLETEF